MRTPIAARQAKTALRTISKLTPFQCIPKPKIIHEIFLLFKYASSLNRRSLLVYGIIGFAVFEGRKPPTLNVAPVVIISSLASFTQHSF